ncbi:MAG: hypothetical protein PHQ19_06825 [Candidatus Krumholzibacteria bacterium]|nr:hypothetical protein [Candidatus Krumholzibacteria bacterium]
MMRLQLLFVIVFAVMIAAAPLTAQTHPCGDGAVPYEGFWTTTDGSLTGGRISEAWCGAQLQPGVPGNTLYVMSYNGASLGLLYVFVGMAIDENGAVETGRDINASGFGWIDYITNYVGGNFWLEGDHTWSDGTDLSGSVASCEVGARVTYYNWQPVGVSSNITVTGVFDQCAECTIRVVANSQRVWDGVSGPMPAGFPPFYCGTSGELHDMCCLQATITCPIVGNEDSSWGAIKDLYR